MSVVPVGVPVLLGLVAAVSVGIVAKRGLRDRPARAVLAGLAAGVLVWSLVAEVTWPAVREFWQRHPSWNATVTAAAVLALTVLIVERVVQLEVARDRERRWKPVARAACEALLVAVADPIREQRGYIYWRSSELDQYAREGAPGREPQSAPAVRQAVLAVAPVMTSTDRLHDLYALALAAMQRAADLDRATGDDPSRASINAKAPWEEESDRLAWWTGVSSEWEQLGAAMRAFEDEAGALLGEIAVWTDELPPWRDAVPPGFEAALLAFREDFPGL